MKNDAYVVKVADYYKAMFRQYMADVCEGRRVAGGMEIAKVFRQRDEEKKGVSGYIFDLDKGVKPLVWMALNLVFPKGVKRGRSLKFSPWQVFDTAAIFGWVKEDDNNVRRFSDAFIEVARKNGKSTWAGALLDYLCFGEIEGASCYIGATSLDQAEETFIRGAEALTLAGHKSVKVANSKNFKQIKWGSGVIRAICATPKDGKLAYGTIMDEYHQHKDNSLINSILSGNVSDQQSLLIRITTAGTELTGVCHEEYMKSKRILSGEIEVPRYFVSIYELDTSDSPDDPKVWAKANPNLGISVSEDSLMGAYEYASSSESDMINFKTKNLNMWCYGLKSWANMPIWMNKCRWIIDENTLLGERAYGALDLSSISDFTSFTLTFFVDGKYLQLTHFWIADSMRDTIARQCRIPLEKWINEGWVTATPGDVIDYQMVCEYIEDCYEKYKINYIAADRWKINELVKLMPPWFVDVAFEFSQGIKSMSPTINDFEREYLMGNVSANGNEVMDWMMSCADMFQDTNGNVKLVKPKSRTGKRIDGVITSVMSLNTAKTQGTETLNDEDVKDMVSFF